MNKIILSVLVGICVPLAGCSWFKSEAQVVKTDVIDCAKADLGQTVVDAGVSILREVVSVIAAGGANWQSELTTLAGHYGADAIACAEKIASDLFKGAASALPSTGALAGDAAAYVRAQQALSGKSFK